MSEDNNKPKFRYFGATNFAVDNALSVFILAILIVAFGISSYVKMPKEQFPEIVMAQIYIGTAYPGNSGADMEGLVTRPIEKELKSLTGVKEITSTSMQDYSTVIVEFNTDIKVDKALQEVKDAVDKAKSELPNDLPSDPDVFDINFSEFPIMTVNLSGEFNVDELRSFGEYLQDEIEGLKEISEVQIKGALDREVKIDVDLPKMQALKISFYDIENAIVKENITMSGGEVLAKGFRRAIRVVGEFETVDEIKDIIVKSENQKPIYIRDFADVSMSFQDRTSYARSDKYPVVSLDVVKRSGTNLLEASDEIKKIIEKAQKDVLPESLKVNVFNDQSVNTRKQVADLENSIISGVILVVLVLLFFLGSRNALFVGIAIPLSMLMGIMILNLLGITMNMVVLFSLILALGLLVDNAIVVVENIYRYMDEGYSKKDAAKKGAGEVAVPIIASTATTLAAFIPLIFWSGLMGEFMKYMPITLIIVLSSSLFVALVINPMLTSWFMSIDMEKTKVQARKQMMNILIGAGVMLLLAVVFHTQGKMALRNLLGMAIIITLVNYFLLRPGTRIFQTKVLPFLERIYNNFIRFSLKGILPIVIFIGMFVLLGVAGKMLESNPPDVVFFPTADPLYVNAFVELPMGTDIEETNTLMEELETKVLEVIEPYGDVIESVLAQVGEDTADPNGTPEPGATPNKARLTVSFVSSEKRGDVSTFDIMEEIRTALQGYAGLQLVVDKNQDGPPTGKPINMEISGEDMTTLLQLTEKIKRYLNEKDFDGVEELIADVKLGKPELIIDVDRQAAGRYEVSTQDIALAIRTSIFGREVSKFKIGEDEYPIMLRLKDEYRYNVDALLNQKITFMSQATGRVHQVPINSVADIEYSSSYSSVKRKDLDRVITIYSNIETGYNANNIIEEMEASMADFDMPDGYEYEFTGEQQEQEEAMAFLSTAFQIALFSIFLILVLLFNNLSSPVIIAFSIFFSLIGVLLGYAFTGMDMVVIMTGVGIISLAGVVVNNAIVLLDYIDLTRERRRKELNLKEDERLSDAEVKESIIKGGETRLRPVLLTAITTILGLIPLAIGFNFNFSSFISELDPQIFIGGDNVALWGPMAWTVIYGLTFATFLTLVVVPVMYWMSYKVVGFVKNLLGYRKKLKEEAIVPGE